MVKRYLFFFLFFCSARLALGTQNFVPLMSWTRGAVVYGFEINPIKLWKVCVCCMAPAQHYRSVNILLSVCERVFRLILKLCSFLLAHQQHRPCAWWCFCQSDTATDGVEREREKKTHTHTHTNWKAYHTVTIQGNQNLKSAEALARGMRRKRACWLCFPAAGCGSHGVRSLAIKIQRTATA